MTVGIGALDSTESLTVGGETVGIEVLNSIESVTVGVEALNSSEVAAVGSEAVGIEALKSTEAVTVGIEALKSARQWLSALGRSTPPSP